MRLGFSASYLTQLAGPNPSRGITERTARRIENILDLPAYYMDQKCDTSPQAHLPGPCSSSTARTLLKEVLKEVASQLEGAETKVSYSKFAQIVALTFEDAEERGGLRREFLENLIQLSTTDG